MASGKKRNQNKHAAIIHLFFLMCIIYKYHPYAASKLVRLSAAVFMCLGCG